MTIPAWRTGLDGDHEFLARAAQRADIYMRQVTRRDDRLELLDPVRHPVRQFGIRRLQRVRKNRTIGEIDAGDIVAHIIERRAADARFTAIGLALADLICEPRRSIEEALRREHDVA